MLNVKIKKIDLNIYYILYTDNKNEYDERQRFNGSDL